MKEKDTNKADREFLDVYLGETHPQEAEPSEQAVHAESAPTPKRISAKMRRGTLEAYKQTFLVPAKLTDRRAVYLSRATQERADFVVRRLGDRALISRASWSTSCAPIWKTTPRRSRNGGSCNPSIQIYQKVHEQYARQAINNRLNAQHAVITGETPELYQSVTTVMQDVSLFPQTALAPPASQPEGGERNHIRSHRPQP